VIGGLATMGNRGASFGWYAMHTAYRMIKKKYSLLATPVKLRGTSVIPRKKMNENKAKESPEEADAARRA